MSLPEGFEATLFAHEPAIRQPIAMTWDARGRLWVVESYSYEEWKRKGEDRIVILEDSNGDGRHDKRTVFWSKGNHFAGIALGMGGVWVADAPNVIFIPDRNFDDVPDGPPEVILTGWTTTADHNMVNGLEWGPDGWLYGRHGVLQWSRVGTPDTADENRTDVNCGIWRYHPLTKKFEHVVRGSTNPWGLDWDAQGEMFMSGNVNGHLWHVIPGAYLERMHPTTRTPYVYERLTMSADQPHYLGTANWKRDWNRGALGRDGESSLGGGHSHCGAMIYLGDQWPADYRGKMFMANTHGRRINIDGLNPRGSSFVGQYEGDFLKANQSWFRGVTLLYGPDGAVYLSDWTDDGECHDHDGVHRTSGRIFRITHGEAPAWHGDLRKRSDDELVDLLGHPNAWFPRQSRLILRERALDESLSPSVPARLWLLVNLPELAESHRLEALWTLHLTDGLQESQLLELSKHPLSGPSLRAWAVRLLTDRVPLGEATPSALLAMAKSDPSARVRLHLASAAQKLTPRERIPLLVALVARKEDHADAIVQRMLWYALEPSLAQTPEIAQQFVDGASETILRFIARRLFEPDLAQSKARQIAAKHCWRADMNPTRLGAALEGALVSLEKVSGLPLPDDWDRHLKLALSSDQQEIRQLGIRMAIISDHAPTITSLIKAVSDNGRSDGERLVDLQPLLKAKTRPEIDQLCDRLLRRGPSSLRRAVLPELPKRPIEGWSDWLLSNWSTLSPGERSVGVDALSARRETAELLVNALANGKVARQEISASQAQQIVAMKNESMNELLDTHWGSLKRSDANKRQSMERYRALISSSTRQPNLTNGGTLYQKNCAACHQLFGEGGVLGPDLTGSDRGNLDYLLQNLVDPSASVAADYRITIVTTKDGRVTTGALVEKDRSSIVLRTLTGEERFATDEIRNRTLLKTSLMPEGLLETLSDEDVVDLIAFLRTRVSAP